MSVVVLAGSLLAIGAGFWGGRSFARTALAPPAPPSMEPAPEPVRERDVTRSLHGARSLEAAEADDPDPFGNADAAVAARPAGWGPAGPARAGRRPRVAVIVVDAERASTALLPFASEPFPLTVLVAPHLDVDTLRAARDGGKSALVGCEGADLDTIRALRRDGAAGIACSVRDPAQARALVAAAGDGIVLDDLTGGDDALYRAARAAHRRAITRDVIVDARDEPGYVDFLFAQALAIAGRSGAAVVAVHARDSSRRALERFAARAQRDGIELVDIGALFGPW